MRITPAIIPESFDDLKEKISLIRGIFSDIQIDVCDGKFVPSKSWPYRGDGGEWEKILREEEGLPFWEEIDFEADLMVSPPFQSAEDWILAGASRVVVHFESLKDDEEFGKIREAVLGRAELGLALHVETEPEKAYSLFPALSFVQLMGISRIGFQGEEFDKKVLNKIKNIRKDFPDVSISVDGGVNLENAEEIISSGASCLVVGSAIFESDVPRESALLFKNLI